LEKGIEQDKLKPCQIFFMAPNIKHQERGSGETPKYIAILIMPKLLEPIAEEYGIALDKLQSTIATAKAHKQLLPICWQFIAESNSQKPKTSLLRALTV